MSDVSGWQTFSQALGYFLKMFFGSAALGTLTGLISALISFWHGAQAQGSRLMAPLAIFSASSGTQLSLFVETGLHVTLAVLKLFVAQAGTE